MADRTRAHVFVTGRVQGVFFRNTTREEAQKHGVDGWVRNLADGRVEAVFEGSEEGVEAMVTFCHEGPERARVESVDIDDGEPEGEDGFVVRR